jgi:small subunit ribosomal protein S2
MPEIPTLLEMLKAGMHFGHKTSKWHPKMAPYIFGVRSNIHIINLEITAQKLKEALDFLRNEAAAGKVVLFVGTKSQTKEVIKKYALECGMPYVNSRWLGGTFTNFETIKKLIQKFKDLKARQASGELAKYTKKEQLQFQKEIDDLNESIGGIESLEKLPDVVFILDVREEKTAVKEALRKKIPVVAVCDTNVNPEGIDYVIPANDDAVRAIEMITRLVAEAIKEGKKEFEMKGTSKAEGAEKGTNESSD